MLSYLSNLGHFGGTNEFVLVLPTFAYRLQPKVRGMELPRKKKENIKNLISQPKVIKKSEIRCKYYSM